MKSLIFVFALLFCFSFSFATEEVLPEGMESLLVEELDEEVIELSEEGVANRATILSGVQEWFESMKSLDLDKAVKKLKGLKIGNPLALAPYERPEYPTITIHNETEADEYCEAYFEDWFNWDDCEKDLVGTYNKLIFDIAKRKSYGSISFARKILMMSKDKYVDESALLIGSGFVTGKYFPALLSLVVEADFDEKWVTRCNPRDDWSSLVRPFGASRRLNQRAIITCLYNVRNQIVAEDYLSRSEGRAVKKCLGKQGLVRKNSCLETAINKELRGVPARLAY